MPQKYLMRLLAFDATFAIVPYPPFILLCNLQLSVHLRILGSLNNMIPVLSKSPPLRPKTLVIDHTLFFSPFFHTLSAPCTHAQLHVNQYYTVVSLKRAWCFWYVSCRCNIVSPAQVGNQGSSCSSHGPRFPPPPRRSLSDRRVVGKYT